MTITTADIMNAANERPELKQSELIRVMGWEDNAALRMKVSRAFKALDKNSPKVEASINPAPQKVEEVVTPDVKELVKVERVSIPVKAFDDTINGSIEAAQWANDLVKNLEDLATPAPPAAVIHPEPQPEVLHNSQVGRDWFRLFVTVAMVLVAVALSIFTVSNYIPVFGMLMAFAVAVIVGIAVEVAFWTSNIMKAKGKNMDQDWDFVSQFEIIHTALLILRFYANAAGMFLFSHGQQTRINEILFDAPAGYLGYLLLSLVMAGLITAYEINFIQITIKRL